MEFSELSFEDYKPLGAHKVFWEYYCKLRERAGNKVPMRTDFDPLKVPSILPKLAVSEYVDEQTQLVRLVGGGHDSLWPENLAGKNLFDYLAPDMIAARQAIYREVVYRPCAMLLADEATDSDGHTIEYSGLVVPTLSRTGAPTIFVGCYEFKANDIELRTSGDVGIVNRATNRATCIDLALSPDQ